jgi:F0F1-type ATP synthase membrane subunit b/b'
MEIVHQLEQLFLGAVPTIIVVLLFYFFMRWAFFGPIMRVLAERSAKIEGARAEAASAEAGAKQELDAYHAEQEAARQEALDNRAKLLKAMRAHAQDDVNAGKKRIAAELEAARAEVERATPELASQIAQAILKKPTGDAGRGAVR